LGLNVKLKGQGHEAQKSIAGVNHGAAVSAAVLVTASFQSVLSVVVATL